MFGQHDGERLEHQGVAGRPEIDLLAVGERDPGEQGEPVAPRQKLGPDPFLLFRPRPSKRLHISIGGIVTPPPTQPVIGRIQNGFTGDVGQAHHVGYCTDFPLLANKRSSSHAFGTSVYPPTGDIRAPTISLTLGSETGTPETP